MEYVVLIPCLLISRKNINLTCARNRICYLVDGSFVVETLEIAIVI